MEEFKVPSFAEHLNESAINGWDEKKGKCNDLSDEYLDDDIQCPRDVMALVLEDMPNTKTKPKRESVEAWLEDTFHYYDEFGKKWWKAFWDLFDNTKF